MATGSSTLAWKIPQTEKPGGLQSIGSQSWARLKRLSIHADGSLPGQGASLVLRSTASPALSAVPRAFSRLHTSG